MEDNHVVTCFLRNRGEVLLLRRSDAVGSYAGRWGAVAGHVEPDPGDERDEREKRGQGGKRGGDADGGPPDSAAVNAATHREIDEETGLLHAVTRVRAGEPFPVADADLGTRWVVHPHLFDCESRAVEPNAETTGIAWVHPTEIRRRETVPDLWRSYERVAPSVETVAGDREHGSAYLSVRALEVLRDRAGVLAFGADDAGTRDGGGPGGRDDATDGHGDSDPADDWREQIALARGLLAARPAMTVVGNRLNRVVDAARGERTAAAVERAAREGVERAVAADDAAAREAADIVAGDRVFTLSRSGTVRGALRQAEPSAVIVAESRPGREGIGVAESFAAECPVTLTTDAAVPWVLADRPVDAVLVGADSVLPDGSVVNKVGTRAAALAAAREGIPAYAVAARDKVHPAGEDGDDDGGDDPNRDALLEPADPAELYDGPADLDLANPLFDVTDPDLLAGVVTEDGLRSPGEIAEIAAVNRTLAAWQDEEPGADGEDPTE